MPMFLCVEIISLVLTLTISVCFCVVCHVYVFLGFLVISFEITRKHNLDTDPFLLKKIQGLPCLGVRTKISLKNRRNKSGGGAGIH
jgi:hypothetical protein